MSPIRFAIGFVCLVLPAFWLAPGASAGSEAEPCRVVPFEGAQHTVCTVDLRKYRVQLFWKDMEGAPFASFARLGNALGSGLAFAMNAGMYDADLSPVGLYVENGRELKRANTANGPGNFHMKPNGIFYVRGEDAGVLETSRYLKVRPKADFATQSGPMLVIDGHLHPGLSEDGPSRKVRNGVGVRDPHTVVFAISDEPVSFGTFARLFRDELNCPNALFLDGSISSLFAPSLNRADLSRPLGPMIAAIPRRN
jgi:uncharacterized protein YigE (DUF2233 family)